MTHKSTSTSQRKTKLGAFAAVLAAIAVSFGATPAVAAGPGPSTAVSSSTPCGFHMDGILARYNHCSHDGSNVYVQVTSLVTPGAPPGLGGGLTLLCLSPGDHALVPFVYGFITGATSDGTRCSTPNA